jgi:hypothetical protein
MIGDMGVIHETGVIHDMGVIRETEVIRDMGVIHDMELDVVVVEGPEDWSLERRLAAQGAREEEERRRVSE